MPTECPIAISRRRNDKMELSKLKEINTNPISRAGRISIP